MPLGMNDNLKERIKQALKEGTNSESAEIEKKPLPRSIFIIPGFVFAVILIGTYLLSSQIKAGPQGKIKSPVVGSETGKVVRVVGETKNIEPGQYVWIVVDKPEIGLCWPKVPIDANTKFSTTILEEGPKGPFSLSLYVLTEHFHKQWTEWKNQEIFGGLPMLPESRRLDLIRLVLK